jgi:hypothetical protein
VEWLEKPDGGKYDSEILLHVFRISDSDDLRIEGVYIRSLAIKHSTKEVVLVSLVNLN